MLIIYLDVGNSHMPRRFTYFVNCGKISKGLLEIIKRSRPKVRLRLMYSGGVLRHFFQTLL